VRIENDSLNVVLLGDWSKYFTLPDWIAEHVFESPEIEIGVDGKEEEIRLAYRKGNVVIQPRQTKVVFSSMNLQIETLNFLSKCVKNFLEQASTPNLIAYGLNCEYIDETDTRLAGVFDSISDSEAIIAMGYTVAATEIKRKLSMDGRIIHMTCRMEQSQTSIHFNEHHAFPEKDSLSVDADALRHFISETQGIVKGLGYEIEVDRDE